MAVIFVIVTVAILLALTFVAWRRYLWVREKATPGVDTCPYSLTDVFGDSHLVNVPHQKGVRWLTEVFSRSATRFPHHAALQIPHTGEMNYDDAQPKIPAAAVSPGYSGRSVTTPLIGLRISE